MARSSHHRALTMYLRTARRMLTTEMLAARRMEDVVRLAMPLFPMPVPQ